MSNQGRFVQVVNIEGKIVTLDKGTHKKGIVIDDMGHKWLVRLDGWGHMVVFREVGYVNGKGQMVRS